jgi:putative transposase
VIRWHRQGFKLYWRRKSRAKKIGRRKISREHINFIRRMSADNPTWGEDKIIEELSLKFGIKHSTSKIRKYMVKRRCPGDRQTWSTFIKNHGREIFACDFLTQHTAFFGVIYVLVVMELGTRRIVNMNVTGHPSLPWVKGQNLHISAFDDSPRFFLHDTDGIFGQLGHPKKGSEGKRYRCHLDLWLEEAEEIKGLPTPYHVPNANARVERFNRTLRECEITDPAGQFLS